MEEHKAPGGPGPAPPEKPAAPEQQPRPPRRPKNRWGPLIRFAVKWTAVAALIAALFTFVLGMHIQHGNRMYPFIMDGDLVITYKLEKYRVGDVVAYQNPVTGQRALSRIVATGPGAVHITEYGELLVDGAAPDEKVFYPTKRLEDADMEYPYTVKGGGYFLLDDFRSEGMDSRLFGQVMEGDLQGKVVYVLRRRGI